MRTISIFVPSIHCPSCIKPVEASLSKIAGLHDLSIQIIREAKRKGGLITFTVNDDAEYIENDVYSTLRAMGHQFTSTTESQYLFRAILCGAVGLPLMLISMLGLSLPFYAMIAIGITSSALTCYAGFDIFKHGILQPLKTRVLTMDSLFTISTLTALTLSVAAFWVPGLSFEFETALLIFASRHLGKYLESKMQGKVAQNLDFLSLLPSEVDRIEAYAIKELPPKTTPIAITKLKPGDIIRVNKGDYLPADGVLLSEHAMIKKTFITGNLLAESVYKNMPLYAGMQVDSQYVLLKVEKPLKDSYLQQWDVELNKVKQEKSATEKFTDKIIQYFIPGVLGLAAVSVAVCLPLFGATTAIHTAMAILVGACPCTLGFITPLAMRVGLDKSAKNGAIIHQPDAIEKAHQAKTILIDLNGTITEGKPQVGTVHTQSEESEAELWPVIHQLEAQLTQPHLVGQALLTCARLKLSKDSTLPEVSDFENVEGSPGIKGSINQHSYALGNSHYMQQQGITVSDTQSQRVYLAKDQKVIAHIDLIDPIRPGTHATLQQLQKNYQVILCTGADEKTANFYAQQLGIDKIKANCHGGLAKAEFIRSFNGKVIMVGDAINDALAIQEADVGIAMANADVITASKASITIHKDGLQPLVPLLQTVQQTMQTVKQNLLISLFYNLFVMIGTTSVVLALGPVAPGLMALFMAAQSLLVLANTYQLKQSPITTAEVSSAESKQSTQSIPKPSILPTPKTDCCSRLQPQISTSHQKEKCCPTLLLEEEQTNQLSFH